MTGPARPSTPRGGEAEPAYPVVVRRLSPEEGGGYLAAVPALPGCMSDGATRAEAEANARRAVAEWLDEARRLGREVPGV